jgi:hypothetical protein
MLKKATIIVLILGSVFVILYTISTIQSSFSAATSEATTIYLTPDIPSVKVK